MTPETNAPHRLRLASLPGLLIERLRSPDPAPPLVGAVGALGGLHILPRYRRRQPQRATFSIAATFQRMWKRSASAVYG